MTPTTSVTTTTRALVALLVGVLLGCNRPPAAVGVLIPQTGDLSAWGQQVLDGILLAWDELPAATRPKLLVKDDASTALAAGMMYQALVDAGATVVIGPLSTDAALAAGLVARTARVPMITPTATGAEVTRDNAYALRFCSGDDEVAAALAAYARYTLQLSRLALVVDLSSRYSLGLAESFGREFQLRQGRLLGEVTYYPQDEDLGRVLDAVAELGAEGALVAGYHDEVTRMLEGASDPRVANLILLGSDGWEGARLGQVARGRVTGAYYTSHFSPDEPGPQHAAFLAAWAKRGRGPPTDFVALGYDTARAVFGEFDPDEDGPGMCRRLLALHHFEGVTGTIQMDPGGNPRGRSVVLEQLHDGQRPTFVRRLDD